MITVEQARYLKAKTIFLFSCHSYLSSTFFLWPLGTDTQWVWAMLLWCANFVNLLKLWRPPKAALTAGPISATSVSSCITHGGHHGHNMNISCLHSTSDQRYNFLTGCHLLQGLYLLYVLMYYRFHRHLREPTTHKKTHLHISNIYISWLVAWMYSYL